MFVYEGLRWICVELNWGLEFRVWGAHNMRCLSTVVRDYGLS